jgi:branched-chain amino acid transport system substrate-binding protein
MVHGATRRAIHWAGATLGATAALAAIAGCGSSGSGGSASGGTYRVGVLADQTGPISAYDKPVVAGLRTYVDALNNKGGVNGHRIVLTVLDTKGYDIPTTRTDFGLLQSQGAVAIEGPLLSTAYQAVQPLAVKSKIALLSAGAPPESVQKAEPYFYLTGISLPTEASIAVKQLAKTVGQGAKPRIAALRTDSVSTEAWASALASSVQSMFGEKLVTDRTLDATAIDPSTQVSQILAAKPDVVMLRIISSQVPLAVKQLRQKGFTGNIISDYGGADTAVLKAVNDPKYLAIRQFEDVNGSSQPAVAAMRSAAQAAGQTASATSSFFTYGYVTGAVIKDVLAKCGASCSSSQFAGTLAGMKSLAGVPGLSGTLSFAPGTHQLVNYGRLYTWSNGEATPQSSWINGGA